MLSAERRAMSEGRVASRDWRTEDSGRICVNQCCPPRPLSDSAGPRGSGVQAEENIRVNLCSSVVHSRRFDPLALDDEASSRTRARADEVDSAWCAPQVETQGPGTGSHRGYLHHTPGRTDQLHLHRHGQRT